MKWSWFKWAEKKPNKVFIIPTKFGFLYGTSLILVLGMAFAYSNNLVFSVCFFLTSLGVSSTFYCHQNLQNLEMPAISVKPFCADSIGDLILRFRSLNHSGLNNINLKYDDYTQMIEDIPSSLETSIRIPLMNFHRGWNSLSSIHVESLFPFQLCRSWKVLPPPPNNSVLVFPRRQGPLPWPGQGVEDLGPQAKRNKHSEDEFSGLKPYEKSDSPRRIEWKSSARSGQIQVKVFESQTSPKLILTWQHTVGLSNLEDRVSQLALWLDEAEKRHFDYQLVLPHWQSPLGQGQGHWQNCMKTLALLDPQHVSN